MRELSGLAWTCLSFQNDKVVLFQKIKDFFLFTQNREVRVELLFGKDHSFDRELEEIEVSFGINFIELDFAELCVNLELYRLEVFENSVNLVNLIPKLLKLLNFFRIRRFAIKHFKMLLVFPFQLFFKLRNVCLQEFRKPLFESHTPFCNKHRVIIFRFFLSFLVLAFNLLLSKVNHVSVFFWLDIF